MTQKPIKLRQDQPQRFEIAEVDENWKELDDRTKYADEDYNSIQLLAEKIKLLEASIGPDIPDWSTQLTNGLNF